MSRIAKVPVAIPAGVDFDIDGSRLVVKGPNGTLEHRLHEAVELVRDGDDIRCTARAGAPGGIALAGTTRALVSNMMRGVTQGFEKRLELVGVGYRAQMQGSALNLALGFSHPVVYEPPEGISLETPSQTVIVVKGTDKQKVGQAAAVIRAFRPPEPYKGKGVKYAGEQIARKEAKKK
jgi:large subunit ribosomal protein L6